MPWLIASLTVTYMESRINSYMYKERNRTSTLAKDRNRAEDLAAWEKERKRKKKDKSIHKNGQKKKEEGC